MKIVTPVVPGWDLPVATFADHQPEYERISGYLSDDPDGMFISRWRLSWKERLKVLLNGDLWVYVLTFQKKLQPMHIQVEKPAMYEGNGV